MSQSIWCIPWFWCIFPEIQNSLFPAKWLKHSIDYFSQSRHDHSLSRHFMYNTAAMRFSTNIITNECYLLHLSLICLDYSRIFALWSLFFRECTSHIRLSQARIWLTHSGFETQRRRHQKSKQGYQWPHKKELCPPKIFLKKISFLWLNFFETHCITVHCYHFKNIQLFKCANGP